VKANLASTNGVIDMSAATTTEFTCDRCGQQASEPANGRSVYYPPGNWSQHNIMLVGPVGGGDLSNGTATTTGLYFCPTCRADFQTWLGKPVPQNFIRRCAAPIDP
jgi:hypothetical protein